MKKCLVCGAEFDAATCPNCGEASFETLPARPVEAAPAQPKRGKR